jgi:hypothetical protein
MLFEKFLYDRLLEHIKISKKQRDFINKRSTMMQIVNLESAVRNMNYKHLSICFLYIKKAYDTVDRKIFLKKIKTMNENSIHKGL